MKINSKIRNRYLFMIDILLCSLGHIMAIIITYPYAAYIAATGVVLPVMAFSVIVYAIIHILFGIYHTDWVYAGIMEYARLSVSCFISSFICILTRILFFGGILSIKIIIVSNFFAVIMMFLLRFGVRVLHKVQLVSHKRGGKRVLIIGAGRLSVTLLRDIYENERLSYNVVGLIDDNLYKSKLRIYNTQVLGTRKDIIRICKEKEVDEIIFAINDISNEEKTAILNICNETDAKLKILPNIENSLKDSKSLERVREIEIEDLLNRDSIVLDNEKIANIITDKTVVVTGGGGSIGSELCRQILKHNPKKLVIIDIYENTTYEVQNELSEKYPDADIDVLIASVRDKKRLEDIFAKYKPDIVFHAAAHKHVPLMENSPGEAIKNNVLGTYNTVLCADKFGAERFVMISTDKAVNPTNVMGASKRMCEMIVQTMQRKSKTNFVAVRFGNVLNSHGSVVPRFEKQIKNGGPVTVTHPDITRFFMTIPEAVQLVLQAATYANGGEIFALDMGKPVKIYDLAKKMIRIFGYVPEKEIKIEFTGLRPGEKLYEEIYIEKEMSQRTAHEKIFVMSPINISEEELQKKIEKLKNVSYDDTDTIKEIFKEVVPTYRSPEEVNSQVVKEPVGV